MLRLLVLFGVSLLAACGSAVSTPTPGIAASLDGVDSTLAQGLAYPKRSAYRIKGLQPDFWPSIDEVVGNNTGGVAVNVVWDLWEPTLKTPPCASAQVEFEGHCFQVDGAAEDAIRRYTERGVVVTAVVYGTPSWARIANCSPAAAGFERFCIPRNMTDFVRFVRFVARRFNGLSGLGRIADFVIWNEVNSNDWFDIGCGQGTACNTDTWIASYASMYSLAFDAVAAEQPQAKTLMSFTHHFGSTFNAPGARHPLLGVETMLRRLAPLVAPRAWRVALHPYPPDLLRPEFSADDFPRVTYGNIGLLSGFLAANFPAVPSALELQLTESGVNSLSPSSPEAQAKGVCDSFRNVLGTPGIENYIYHRMRDNPDETQQGLGVGLRQTDGTAKPAWSVWALANRTDLSPPRLSCGFEHLPYTVLTRSFNAQRGHWASTRLPPSGFQAEGQWRLLREPFNGGVMLYECKVGAHNLVTREPACEGQQPLGPLGYAAQTAAANRKPIYRCFVASSGDHFVSTDPRCEGQRTEQLLGYGF
jgi:Family of unknown function (DUF5722)